MKRPAKGKPIQDVKGKPVYQIASAYTTSGHKVGR